MNKYLRECFLRGVIRTYVWSGKMHKKDKICGTCGKRIGIDDSFVSFRVIHKPTKTTKRLYFHAGCGVVIHNLEKDFGGDDGDI